MFDSGGFGSFGKCWGWNWWKEEVKYIIKEFGDGWNYFVEVVNEDVEEVWLFWLVERCKVFEGFFRGVEY